MTTLKKYIILSLHYLFIGIITLSGQQDTLTTSVYFETAQSTLTPVSQEILTQLSTEVRQYGDYYMDIAAHTDDRGTNNYNYQLATQRANSVKEFLIAQGVSTDHTTIKNFGETQQEFNNISSEIRQLNRRVDIIITPIKWTDLTELTTQMKTATQSVFTLDPTTDTKLVGKEGTTLWVQSDAFELPNGDTPKGDIEVVLTESLDYAAMMDNGLFTTSNGQLLETGGMIKIEATADGQLVQLKQGATLLTAMPTQQFDPRMQLFYGATNESGDTLTDWIPINQKPKRTLEANLLFAPKPISPTRKIVTWSIPDHLRPTYPKAPKPLCHSEPTRPKREQIRYNPPFLTRLFCGKKKLTAIKEKKYQQQLERYNQQILNNERRQNKYSHDLKKYESDIAAYYVAMDRLDAKQEAFEKSPEAIAAQTKQDSLYQIRLVNYKLKVQQWEKYKEKKLAAYETEYEQKGGITKADMDNYIFKVTQLGWVNIDVFYNTTETNGNLELAGIPSEEVSTFLVFKSIKSVIKISPDSEGNYSVKDLPIGLDAQIIAINVEDGNALLATTDVSIQKKQTVNLVFQPTRLKDIRAYMSALN